ncbi:MAG: hypothetical protein B6242_01660 [Anaerolineaceae bacterium 4572_78]|nr:MAG: hypothetical protein B6242_01660 [Anaerolineaceae bacterium 4572_78]
MTKQKKISLVVVSLLVIVALLVPFVMQADRNKIPPPPPFPLEGTPQFEGGWRGPDGKPPTATPNPIEAKETAKHSPRTKRPVMPTMEMIDLAPDIPHLDKSQITVRRGKSGKTVVLLLDPRADKEAILEKHLNHNEGDEVLHTTLPMRGFLEFVESMKPEIINLAPGTPYCKMYQIVGKRGQTGKTVIIMVAIDTDKEDVIKAYFDKEAGDEFKFTAPVPGRDHPDCE